MKCYTKSAEIFQEKHAKICKKKSNLFRLQNLLKIFKIIKSVEYFKQNYKIEKKHTKKQC